MSYFTISRFDISLPVSFVVINHTLKSNMHVSFFLSILLSTYNVEKLQTDDLIIVKYVEY